MREYFVICIDKEMDDCASLNDHDELGFEEYKFDRIVPLSSYFVSPIKFYMDKDDEDARELYDFLDNDWNMLIISERTKEVMNSVDTGEVEFLPVQIIDQKNKPVEEKYFIVNTLESIEYIDEDKSVVTYSYLLKDKIDDIDKLVMNEKNLIESRDIFRTSIFTAGFHIVSISLKEKLENLEVEGVIFVPIDEFESMERM